MLEVPAPCEAEELAAQVAAMQPPERHHQPPAGRLPAAQCPMEQSH